MDALQLIALRNGACVIGISEVNRGAYGSKDAEASLASFKESSAIEYKSDVALTLARVQDESAPLVDVTLHKSRLGDQRAFRLQRTHRCTFEHVERPDNTEVKVARREKVKAAQVDARDDRVAALVDRLVTELVKAQARGIEITGQRGLKALIKGTNEEKQDAVSRAIADGRIRGGNRKPYTVHNPEGEGESEGE